MNERYDGPEQPASEDNGQKPSFSQVPPYQPLNPEEAAEAPKPLRRKREEKPWVTYTLMGLCILFFVAQSYSLYQTQADIPFIFLGKINKAILAGQFWRLLTPAFLHGNIYHILFNMYALYILGNRIEKVYGHGRFLLLYIISAFGGNVLSFVLSKSNSLGSSTAIFGLLAANLVLLITNKEFFGENFRPILMNLVFLLFINLSIGLMPGSSIDNFGHLGGMIAGFFYAILSGPKWVLQREGHSLRVKDSRTQTELWLGALVVSIAFMAMALIPFLHR
ncbi:MAG: rhomboid family intramembrane serine protease [Anaerolineaceae bacterium]|nr:rhomboid family intramembrane serine protease [Anaerolineaceae bacterium]